MNIFGAKKSVVHIITGLDDGGAEAVLYRLCVHDKSDVTHFVVSLMDAGKYGSLLEAAGVRVTCLNMPRGRLTPKGLWRLWCLLREEKPDVVQTWMYHADLIGGILARLSGVRRVFWGIRHTALDARHSKRSTILVAKLCALISRWVPAGIVCCAQKTVEIHRELGYSANKLTVIPNGYDLSQFSIQVEERVRLRSEWEIGGMSLLGMVGRFDPMKDHYNLLKALGELKQSGQDFVAVLVGRGLDTKNKQLLGWLQEMDLMKNVKLLGQRTDIPAVMNALDFHVLSSCTEAFPNVLAEAMACGTPVITTDVGDAALIVGDAGWVVPPRDHLALANALQSAMSLSPEACVEKGKVARVRIVEHFSIEKMVSSYHEVWHSK